ncbi:acyl-CoA dehydrogenase [Lampropedia puyangensis]|uniref:Acyl-CoA dehydrogenase n=1 Tax=Lampropedia puyangensis TaxID=1330072 RepID=A0A4V4GQL7_9BURK|nr:acyl-CoA dehydrogenase family protein [Lampropedia puyangensis]THT98095.1 acyl-CoA dehydrogenase [Lampropedia puyangensis]
MNFNFTPEQQRIYDLVGELGRSVFAPRAAQTAQEARTPVENLKALQDAKVTPATVSVERGGLGGGAAGTDPLISLLAVEQTARYCLSTAQCLHIHFNATHRMEILANEDQLERIIKPVVEEAALLNSTGSEPGRTARGLYNLQTSARRVDGGYVLNGVKNYATIADVVSFNILYAIIEGQEGNPEGHLGVAIPQGAEGLEIVEGSWDPLGMRGAFSPHVKLTECFVPDHNVVGAPGTVPKGKWQAKSHLSFAAQYVGASEGIFEFLVDYLPKRGTAGDSYAQLRLGQIRIAIDAARLMLYKGAWLWRNAPVEVAERFAMNAKYQALEVAEQVATKGAQIAGSTAFATDTPISRIVRDLRVQTLHENIDKTAATIGKFHLGQAYDVTARL